MKQVICIKRDDKGEVIRYTEPVPDEINPITGAMAKAGEPKPKVFDSITWERNMKHMAEEYGLEVVEEKYVKPQDRANDVITVQVIEPDQSIGVEITEEEVLDAPVPYGVDLSQMNVKKVIEYVKNTEMTDALRAALLADERVSLHKLAK